MKKTILLLTLIAVAGFIACDKKSKCEAVNIAANTADQVFSNAKNNLINRLLPQCYQTVPGFQNNLGGALMLGKDTLLAVAETISFYQTHQDFPTLSETTQNLVIETGTAASNVMSLDSAKTKAWEAVTKCERE